MISLYLALFSLHLDTSSSFGAPTTTAVLINWKQLREDLQGNV